MFRTQLSKNLLKIRSWTFEPVDLNFNDNFVNINAFLDQVYVENPFVFVV
jgi:hypothetical protein